MRILITGGRGYLAGRLCQFLASSGEYQIFSGSRRYISEPGLVGRVMDWSSQDSLRACCVGIDTIVHLAGMNATDCSVDPVAALVMNGVGTAKLLEAAKKEGVKRFIYVSTAHVYGNPLEGNITEAMCPLPAHPYATSHKAAEDIVLAAQKAQEIDGIVLRVSNAFGAPIQSDTPCWDLLFNDLCRQAVTKKSITLRSSGLQRRDFIPITDVCRTIVHMLSFAMEPSRTPLFNVGGNWSPTVFEAALILADRVEHKLGCRPTIKRVNPTSDEAPSDLNYNIGRLTQSGFSLKTDRLDELDGLINFCLELQ